MAILELDHHTAEQLKALAAASGMTVEAYLKLLLPPVTNATGANLTLAELELLLTENSFEGSTLPAVPGSGLNDCVPLRGRSAGGGLALTTA